MKSWFFKTVYVMAFVVVILNMVFMIIDTYKADIEDLPEGTLVYTTLSPDKAIELRVYKVDCSVGKAVRVQSVSKQKNIKRNIFWNTGESSAEIIWYSDREVYINGMPLNVIEGDGYDCRRGMSIFLAGSVEE